jgi:hypothetical protein
VKRSLAAAATLVAVLSESVAMAAPPAPPRSLDELATDLRCAVSEAEARKALQSIADAGKAPLQLNTAGAEVRAENVDALLHALAHARRAFPSLHTEVDEVVLSWNYCDVFFKGEAWDLGWVDGQMMRAHARPPARGYGGFRSWGFVPVDEAIRVVPMLLLENPLGRGQREWFIGAAILEQCFPHPITGRSTFDNGPAGWIPPGVRSSPVPIATLPGTLGPEWSEKCPERAAAPPPAAAPSAAAGGASKSPGAGAASALARSPRLTASGPPPFVPIAPLTSGGAGGPLQPVIPDGPSHGFSGNVRTTAALAHVAPSVGTSAGWAPYDYAFVRVGIDQRLNEKPFALPTYSWGLGYNDWHPGTFSAEINNWAVPINKFNAEAIALSLGYKPVLPAVLQPYFGVGIDMTIPFGGPPTFGVAFAAKPYGSFFLMSAVRFAPFAEKPAVTWSYGFGYSDWHPYSIALQYNNWGPNPVFTPNFVDNGSVTLSWSWAY